MSEINIAKTLHNVDQNILHVIKEGADNLSKPGATDEDWDKFWHDVRNVFTDTPQKVGDLTVKEAKEGVKRQLIARGHSPDVADDWSSKFVKRVVDYSEKVRKTVQKNPTLGNLAWLKLVGGIAVLAAALTTFFAIISGPTPQQQSELDLLNRTQNENDEIQRLVATPEEFTTLVRGLSSAPDVQPDPTPPAAAAVELPVAIAPIAAVAVEVQVTTPSAPPQTFHTNVAQAYRYAPPRAQQAMVRQWHNAPQPQSEPESQPEPQSEPHHQPFQSEITVETEFSGSQAHFIIQH